MSLNNICGGILIVLGVTAIAGAIIKRNKALKASTKTLDEVRQSLDQDPSQQIIVNL